MNYTLQYMVEMDIYFFKIECVFYKGHTRLSYSHLSTTLSFTHFYKGHTIYVGPREGKQILPEFSPETLSGKNPGGIPSRDLSKN